MSKSETGGAQKAIDMALYIVLYIQKSHPGKDQCSSEQTKCVQSIAIMTREKMMVLKMVQGNDQDGVIATDLSFRYSSIIPHFHHDSPLAVTLYLQVTQPPIAT